jgi:chromosome segregation ATPase
VCSSDLNARWGHLQRRTAALDQSRAEALRLQREAMEMRLATEELWAQMSGMAPPAAITQSLAMLRAKLAKHHQFEQAELSAQRQQIEELAAKVAKQHEKLAAQRRSFEAWTFEQKREIQSQTATIKTHDEELRQQREQIQQQRRQWDAKRSELEREIRHLQAERHQAEALTV